MSNKVSWLFIAQDKYSRIAEKINRQTKKLQGSFDRLRASSTKFAKGFKKSARGVVSNFKAMAAAALAFFSIRQFFTVGARFQDSMADLSAITGATGEDLEKLQGTILKFAKDASISADQVAEAFKLVASAKPELLENLDALAATTEQVLLLKNAAGIELASAAEIAAQGLNIFGAGADQAARFVNVLAAGAKLGSSEIADTGAALLIAGPGARAAGLSFEQLNAAIQATAKGGIKGTRAGTALNAIFGRLQRQGIDFQKLGLQGSFELIKKKMDSLTSSTARAQFVSTVFGEEHSKVGLAIMANAQLLGQYERTLAGTNIAQEQANLRLSTFSAKARKMGIILNEALIKAFLRLEPTLTKVVNDMSAFFASIRSEDIEAFADSMKALIEVAKVVGTALSFVFSILKAIGTLIGEVIAAIMTFDFSQFSETTKDLLATFAGPIGLAIRAFTKEEEKTPATAQALTKGEITPITPLGGKQASRTDVNVNLNAPSGVVSSVKSKTTGKVAGMNVGVNMAEAL